MNIGNNQYTFKSLEERFWSKVKKGSGCWLWLASLDGKGYGAFPIKGKSHTASRVAYELTFGVVPKGLVVDHKCKNIKCVNPSHLEAVTQRENVLRGEAPASVNAKRTHCKTGHPLSGDNIYHYKGKRCCKTCNRKSSRIAKKNARLLAKLK